MTKKDPIPADVQQQQIKTHNDSEAALAKLVSIARAVRQKHHGPPTTEHPTGKVYWKTPTIGETLKASEAILRMFGDSIDSARAIEIIRGSDRGGSGVWCSGCEHWIDTGKPKGWESPDMRTLARQLRAAFGETRRREGKPGGGK